MRLIYLKNILIIRLKLGRILVKKVIKIFIDLDGTICGSSDWKSYILNTKRLFETGLLMDIPKHSWSILTARPRIDRWIIKRVCKKYRLYPDKIITSPTMFYKFEGKQDRGNWKYSVLSKELEDMFVTDVIYVDDDAEDLSNITNQQGLILCKPPMLNKLLNDMIKTEELNG